MKAQGVQQDESSPDPSIAELVEGLELAKEQIKDAHVEADTLLGLDDEEAALSWDQYCAKDEDMKSICALIQKHKK